MSDLNVYTATGRLAADAELKFSQGGTAILSARMAVGYGWGDNKATNWITVKLLGKRAETIGGWNLAKGQQVAVSGELQVREFERKDGTKGTAVEVLAQSFETLGKPQEGGTSSSGPRGGAPARERPARATAPASDFGDDFESDSIPFATNRGTW